MTVVSTAEQLQALQDYRLAYKEGIVQWFLDRQGSAGVTSIKAARCEWDAVSNTLTINTKLGFLRNDSFNITKAVDAIASKYQATYKMLVSPSDYGNAPAIFRMELPRPFSSLAPAGANLKQLSAILCNLMWGATALDSEESQMNNESEITMADVNVALDKLKIAKKESNFQQMFNKIMTQGIDLADMDLKGPSEKLKVAISETAKPFVGKPMTEVNKDNLTVGLLSEMNKSPIDVEALKLLQNATAWTAQTLGFQQVSLANPAAAMQEQAEPTKDSDSPTAVELATLEHESLGREC